MGQCIIIMTTASYQISSDELYRTMVCFGQDWWLKYLLPITQVMMMMMVHFGLNRVSSNTFLMPEEFKIEIVM